MLKFYTTVLDKKMLQVDDKVIADIARGFAIPPQPSLLIKLQQLMANKEPDINELAQVISQDVAISATVLKTVNSPIYGLSRSISDIHMAARYIGSEGILLLVTNCLLRKSFQQSDSSITLEEFWHNANNIANTSVLIGNSLTQNVSKDRLFTLGLFHDCGIPVMASKYADYSQTYEHALKTPSETLTAIEESVYQVNHATLGYYVASSWRLPKDICQLILCHHDREFLSTSSNQSQRFYFAILKMAENIVHRHKYFRDAADWPYISDSVLAILDMADEDYQDLLEDSAEQQI
ncbi:HDOD domain-containing protein [Thalassotalea insulae]|uniref:HDOD domain-containing protein n=1 Tax=Thalassotalea insulae TaxID=2056778 RepID=UPI0024E125B9|nr:HDOD domain-containing protein [Thalassotalea insulae]